MLPLSTSGTVATEPLPLPPPPTPPDTTPLCAATLLLLLLLLLFAGTARLLPLVRTVATVDGVCLADEGADVVAVVVTATATPAVVDDDVAEMAAADEEDDAAGAEGRGGEVRFSGVSLVGVVRVCFVK